MDKKRLEEIKKRCRAATPGPWRCEPAEGYCVKNEECGFSKEYVDEDCEKCEYFSASKEAYVAGALPLYFPDYNGMSTANAEFAANARQDIPDMLNYIDLLEEILDDIPKACNKVEPEILEQYLRDNEWGMFPVRKEEVKIFQKKIRGELFQVNIPQSRDFWDYEIMMDIGIGKIAGAENRKPWEILVNLIKRSKEERYFG